MQTLPFMANVTHAWGIDLLWSDVSARLERRVGVVDSVVADHMRKSGVSNLYKKVGGLEKAQRDQLAFKNKWGIREEVVEAADTFAGGEVLVVPATPMSELFAATAKRK